MSTETIPAGSKVIIIRGPNTGRNGIVQSGTWPNQYGNYGVNVNMPTGNTIGYWIAAGDLKLETQPQPAAQPQPQAQAQTNPVPAEAAVGDWIQVNDPKSGRMYWHNKKTRASSWSRPDGI